jgi:hypothetical protein
MSEPKRYSDLDVWKALHFGENTSGWVKYDDYARLKAEVERHVEENAHLHKGIYSLSLNVVQLKDEVERLTKAGDAVCESPYLWETDPAVIAWRAAKEASRD